MGQQIKRVVTGEEIRRVRQDLEGILAGHWNSIMDNPHANVNRTRVVNSIEPYIREIMQKSYLPCEHADICKYFKPVNFLKDYGAGSGDNS